MLNLYVDSALRADAEPLLALGIFRGITTNPVLLDRAGLREERLRDFYRWATAAGADEVFFQAWGETDLELIRCARRLLDIGPQVVVKLVASRAGVYASATLARGGAPVLLTAVYNAQQALLAAAAGVAYVAPYLGRMSDAGRPAHDEIAGMARALRGVRSETRILVASVRTPADVVRLAQEGIDGFALSPAVAHDFFTEPLTDAAIDDFDRAARRVTGAPAATTNQRS